MQLDHFNIAAPIGLLEQARDFYVNVLGFREGERPGFSRRGFWLYSEGRPFVHLIESDQHSAAQGRVYLDHIAFRSSGLAEVRDRLEAHGVEFRDSHIPEFDMTQLFFKDPAGTGLEINFPGET
jgi:catechol 2,3-dioxygenase-like lactoylglutathione lyase family enzyme